MTATAASVALMWVRKVSTKYSHLGLVVAREVCTYLLEVLLPLVSQHTLQLFDCQSERWLPAVSLSHSIRCDHQSRYTIVGVSAVLVCGGISYSGYRTFEIDGGALGTESYLLSFRSVPAIVTSLPHLTESRSFHGLVHYSGASYVFGGKVHTGCMRHSGRPVYCSSGKPMTPSQFVKSRTGEMRVGDEWKTLAGKMAQGRYSFTPAAHADFVYLCGGEGATTVESFDIVRGEFLRPLEVLLPQATQSLSYVHLGRLTTLLSNFQVVIDLPSQSAKEAKSTDLWRVVGSVNAGPILYKGAVFTVCCHSQYCAKMSRDSPGEVVNIEVR